jgi:Tfp pilus assembly protein PilN
MQTHNRYLNAGGATGAGGTGGAGLSSGVSSLISTAIDFGVQYLYAQKEKEKNEELLQRMAELDAQQAEKLKKMLSDANTEVAKTAVIIEFLNNEKIKKLEDKTKKDRILPLIGLGFGIVLLSLIFYKLNKQSTNG